VVVGVFLEGDAPAHRGHVEDDAARRAGGGVEEAQDADGVGCEEGGTPEVGGVG